MANSNERIKHKLFTVLFICTSFFIGGCKITADSFKKAIDNASEAFNNEVARAKAKANEKPSVNEDAAGLKKAGIVDIFVNHPYDENKKSAHQWPRVAIEVLSSPSNINDFYAGQGISGIPKGCFEMKATIWKTLDKKTISDPFQFCFATDIAWGVPLRSYQDWATRWDLTNTFRQHSGNKRNGVVPPDSFAPDNIKYQRHFSNAFITGKAYSSDSVLGLMLFSIAAHAGIDPSVSSDHRLWFTRISPL